MAMVKLLEIQKTDAGLRTITLSGTVVALLRHFKKQQLEDRLRLGSAWRQVDDILFVHEDGAPVHPHYPYSWFTRFWSATAYQK